MFALGGVHISGVFTNRGFAVFLAVITDIGHGRVLLVMRGAQ